MAVREGDVIRVPESAYLYGAGWLHLRVTTVHRPAYLRDRAAWVRLSGHVVFWDGSQDPVEKTFEVAVSALPGQTLD